MREQEAEDLALAVQGGDRRAIARAMTAVENRVPGHEALIDRLYPGVGNAWRIGITGPPGAGKSTLVSQLALTLRASGQTVGIVAVDPTSPFTGGAVLGDRIRMDGDDDEGIFFRSVASRGSSGGLSIHASTFADILDAAGKNVIIVETVGVGQAEVDIADACDTTVVILVPESGDGVQAIKAGLMEIADVFCINKSDHGGADAMIAAVEAALDIRTTAERRPPVVRTTATSGEGISDLRDALDAHRDAMMAGPEWTDARAQRYVQYVRQLALDEIDRRLRSKRVLESTEELARSPEPRTPFQRAQALLASTFGKDSEDGS